VQAARGGRGGGCVDSCDLSPVARKQIEQNDLEFSSSRADASRGSVCVPVRDREMTVALKAAQLNLLISKASHVLTTIFRPAISKYPQT